MAGKIKLGEVQEFVHDTLRYQIRVDYLDKCPVWCWYNDGPFPVVVDVHMSVDIKPQRLGPSWTYERFRSSDPERNFKLILSEGTYIVGKTGDFTHPSLPDNWLTWTASGPMVEWKHLNP